MCGAGSILSGCADGGDEASSIFWCESEVNRKSPGDSHHYLFVKTEVDNRNERKCFEYGGAFGDIDQKIKDEVGKGW